MMGRVLEMQDNQHFMCHPHHCAGYTQVKLLPVIRGEMKTKVITIKIREHWRNFYMVKKSVNHQKQ